MTRWGELRWENVFQRWKQAQAFSPGTSLNQSFSYKVMLCNHNMSFFQTRTLRHIRPQQSCEIHTSNMTCKNRYTVWWTNCQWRRPLYGTTVNTVYTAHREWCHHLQANHQVSVRQEESAKNWLSCLDKLEEGQQSSWPKPIRGQSLQENAPCCLCKKPRQGNVYVSVWECTPLYPVLHSISSYVCVWTEQDAHSQKETSVHSRHAV